ncbi:MAG TPA: hypothetical protein PK228_21275, partial [Saprospiraceae bacterium]|nr:hypothetical protein [Saprospiraceae bacterium]
RLLDSRGQSENDTSALVRRQKYHGDIQYLVDNKVLTIENADHNAVLERLRKKIFAEECRQCWNRFATEMKSAEEMLADSAYIQICKHAQNALDALKGNPKCKLDKSAAEKMLDKYKPAADYAIRRSTVENSLKDQNYRVILNTYPGMDSIYANYGLGEMNIKHLTLTEFIIEKKNRGLLSFTISQYYTNPDKKGLVQALLSKEQFEKTEDLNKTGFEVGQHLKSTGTNTSLEEILKMHQLEPRKNDRAFKKGIREGFKNP